MQFDNVYSLKLDIFGKVEKVYLYGEISPTLHEKESEILDFKMYDLRKESNINNLVKSIISFANRETKFERESQGKEAENNLVGKVVIGVYDKNREVVG
jgi:predicted HTH transcriptional regulator